MRLEIEGAVCLVPFVFLAVFFGALAANAVSASVARRRRPYLTLKLGGRNDRTFPDDGSYPARRMSVLTLILRNERLGPLFSVWLSRAPAVGCRGTIAFHKLDGTPIFDRPMHVRFVSGRELTEAAAKADSRRREDDRPFDPPQGLNIEPGGEAALYVVARFDDDAECYGWSDESDRCEPLWRHPDWRIDDPYFLVRVTVEARDGFCSGTFRIINESQQGVFVIDAA